MQHWKLTFLLGLAAMPLCGCGPKTSDYVDTYYIQSTETFTNCVGGDSEPTKFYYMDKVEILEGSTSELIVRAANCDLAASMNASESEGMLSVSSQLCTLESDPLLTVELAGEGSVVDNRLTLNLIGSYEREQYGFKVRCDYALDVVTVP